MSRIEMNYFVEDKISEGMNRTQAIFLLANFLGEEIPSNIELWFQQKVCGE
jgi:hypothetical protein